MTRTLPVALLCCSILFAAGCGGDEGTGDTGTQPPDTNDPFNGTYRVTSHTRDETGCTGPGTEVMGGDAFFNLQKEFFLGVPILGYRSCTDATTCSKDANLFESFNQEDGTWVRIIGTASGTEPTCSVSESKGTLVKTATGLSLEIRTLSGELMVSAGEPCDTDLIDKRRDELSCTAIELIAADKL